MFALLCFVLAVLVWPFKARRRLEAENAMLRHQKAREDEWQAAGNTGPVPHEPLEPPPAETARRLDRETWRKIAEMHAREIFLTSGEFDELQAAYAMSDADLWRTLAKREAGDDACTR